MDCVSVLLRHHVHMALKDDTLHVLAARSCRLADDDVADLVLDGLEAMLLTPVIHVLHCEFLMLRRAWNLCQCVEVLPHDLWIKFFNAHNISVLFKYYIYRK